MKAIFIGVPTSGVFKFSLRDLKFGIESSLPRVSVSFLKDQLPEGLADAPIKCDCILLSERDYGQVRPDGDILAGIVTQYCTDLAKAQKLEKVPEIEIQFHLINTVKWAAKGGGEVISSIEDQKMEGHEKEGGEKGDQKEGL